MPRKLPHEDGIRGWHTQILYVILVFARNQAAHDGGERYENDEDFSFGADEGVKRIIIVIYVHY